MITLVLVFTAGGGVGVNCLPSGTVGCVLLFTGWLLSASTGSEGTAGFTASGTLGFYEGLGYSHPFSPCRICPTACQPRFPVSRFHFSARAQLSLLVLRLSPVRSGEIGRGTT